jgi:hypothetical protein
MRYKLLVVCEREKMDEDPKLRAWRVPGFAGRIPLHRRRRIHFPLRPICGYDILADFFLISLLS